jgi:pSer/pThr/pTyr-binding forkhead associated (FHA) protein
MISAKRFRDMTISKQPGELARLRVLAGPDHGSVFVLSAFPITVGRGENNHIVLTDLKSSRIHAEFNIQAGQVVVRDLGSTHGIAINGKNTAFSILRSNDKIAIGGTVLEYIGSAEQGATQFINMRPLTTSSDVGTGSSGYTQFIPKAQVSSKQMYGAANSSQSFFMRNKKMLYLVGGLMAIAFLLPEAEKQVRKKKEAYIEPKTLEAEREIASVQGLTLDEKTLKTADIFYLEGHRELRSKNYLRARIAFQTATQVNPGHTLAHVYLKKTLDLMAKEAKQFIDTGKKNIEAGRYQQAKKNFEAVLSLYSRDKDNDRYKDAQEQIKKLSDVVKDMEKQ